MINKGTLVQVLIVVGSRPIDRCVANFLEIVTVEEFLKNRPIYDEVMCRAFGVHFFWPTLYMVQLKLFGDNFPELVLLWVSRPGEEKTSCRPT